MRSKKENNPPVIITGAHGLLGTKLQAHFPDACCPTHQEMDVSMHERWHYPCFTNDDGPFTLIHCAAVKTVECDENPHSAMNTNIVGTAYMVNMCHTYKSKMIYISTDYVFKGDRGDYAPDDEVCPQNYYAETKLAGEYIVKSLPHDQWLIVRLSFFPDEFPYPAAFTDQWTTRVPVSKAAKEIANLVEDSATGIHHICGPKQTVYDYALSTANGKDIKTMKMEEHTFNRPRDTSLVHGKT